MLKPRKSPSNTYIAICIKMNFEGLYFKKFTMPENTPLWPMKPLEYFVNVVDVVACVLSVCAIEDMDMEVRECE